MCRYGDSGPYKNHFACFTCRKAYKKPPISDWLAVRDLDYVYKELYRRWGYKRELVRREKELGFRLADLEAEYHNATQKCPECGEQMIDMGLDFKPPRQKDIKAWRILQGLYRTGHVFHTCGCSGPGFIPKSKVDYRRYLEDRKKQYTELLQHSQHSEDWCSERKRDSVEYWVSRIAAIDYELTKVS